jgi:beta-N-acetylhexosaminidase
VRRSHLFLAAFTTGLLVAGLLTVASHHEQLLADERRFIDVELSPPDGEIVSVEPALCVPGSVEERAAAVLVVGMPGVTAPDHELAVELTDLGVGGVLITKVNVRDEEQISELLSELRSRSRNPLLVATDEEFGRVSSFRSVLGGTSAPRTLARTLDPDAVRERAEDLGEELRSLGVDMALAPVADLDDGPWDGVIGDRSFSADPERTSTYVTAHAEGLRSAGVLPVVKHFPGHGRTRVDSHRRLDVVEATLNELGVRDLVPFKDQIAAGVPAVMLAHVAFAALDPELPASLAPQAYDLLRSMGFEGVAMTDSLGMGAINLNWDFPEAAVMAVAAGADAVLATDGRRARDMRDALVDAVETGALPVERLDEAVLRMRVLAGADPTELACP